MESKGMLDSKKYVLFFWAIRQQHCHHYSKLLNEDLEMMFNQQLLRETKVLVSLYQNILHCCQVQHCLHNSHSPALLFSQGLKELKIGVHSHKATQWILKVLDLLTCLYLFFCIGIRYHPSISRSCFYCFFQDSFSSLFNQPMSSQKHRDTMLLSVTTQFVIV